jgi:hypothetical protein
MRICVCIHIYICMSISCTRVCNHVPDQGTKLLLTPHTNTHAQDIVLRLAGGGWGRMHQECPNEWLRLHPDGEDATLRNTLAALLPAVLDKFAGEAENHLAAAMDMALDWSMDSVTERQQKRKAALNEKH